jgi:hypothetical protein
VAFRDGIAREAITTSLSICQRLMPGYGSGFEHLDDAIRDDFLYLHFRFPPDWIVMLSKIT